MDTINEFFEPLNGFGTWIGKFLILCILSYLIVWLIAFILSRLNWIARNDNHLKVYFAWMIPSAFLILDKINDEVQKSKRNW